MEKWSDTAWQAAMPIYMQIIEHPFIKELMNGTLPREKFDWYIRQDILYMRDYARVMNLLADRFADPQLADMFRRLAMENIDAEQDMHVMLREQFSSQSSRTEPSPTCLLLASHLYKAAAEPRLEVALAAVLPCFAVYEKVGRHIGMTPHRASNPYLNWIQTYDNNNFSVTTVALTEICDKMVRNNSEISDTMTEAFVLGTKLEWLFWDAAYNMEQWKI